MSEPGEVRAIDRVDAQAKVSGQAQYSLDVPIEQVTHALIATSAIARGRIAEFTVDAARSAAGVLAVITHLNAPRLPGATTKAGPIDRILQLLQDDQVHYGDQPIAVIVAETLEQAQHAVQLLRVRYEPSDASIDLEGSIAQAYTPEGSGPIEEPATKRGDVDAALARSAVRIDRSYGTPNEHHNPMEMHGTLASWEDGQHVTLHDATQGIFGVRTKVATVFGLPPENVRIVSRYVGGGFGCKGSTWSHVVLAALASRVVGRPVKLSLTRQQMFGFVGYRPRTIQRVTLGADPDGKLRALRHTVVSETSRIDEFTEPCALQSRMLYACENVETSHQLVRLDVPTPTFMRAPGESSGTFALESAMDELAYALEFDPLELRLRNYAERDLQQNKPFASKSLRACYQQAAERFGWERRKHAPRSMRDGRTLIGWGMATATYPARQSPASARARIGPDGAVLVQAGTQDIGTGTYTIMSQIAADALNVPVTSVRFELGDTTLPPTPISGGSQTASSTGSAVKAAALALRARLMAAAAADAQSALYGTRSEELEIADGVMFVRDVPARREPLAVIVVRSGQNELSASADAKPDEQRERFSHHSFGAQFFEVQVDEELGEIRVTRAVAAFAAGRILNPKTARSQFQGGMVWGIGMALHEHSVRDPHSGRVVTRDLADYRVPVNADVPQLDVIMVDEVDLHVNELGAKGIGEIGITGAAAALANAVYHATGKRIRELPITRDKLLEV